MTHLLKMALPLFVWIGSILIIKIQILQDMYLSRICGQVFNSVNKNDPDDVSVPVFSNTKPFNIYVHTDSVEGTSIPFETLNRGFCLNFVQQPCNSSAG